MIDNQGNQNAAGNSDDSDGEEEPRTMTLMGGVVSEDPDAFDDQTPLSAENKLLNKGSLLIILVAALAAGSIYLMRLSVGSSLHEDNSTRQAEARVETWLGKLSHPDQIAKDDPMRPANIRNLFANTDSIIKMFASDFSGEQVPIKYVKKNPFELVSGKPSISETDAEEQLAMRQLRSSLKSLTLQSVLGGSDPVAVINSNLKRVGDTIGQFKIVSIGELSVKLQAKGKTFELRMNDGQQNGG